MMNQEEAEFYGNLREAIRLHPQWMLSAMQAIHAGMEQRLRQEQREKSEWETIAFNAMEARIFKGNKMWLSQKIDRLHGNSLFDWGKMIERLQK